MNSEVIHRSDLQCKDTMFNSESFLTILKTSDNTDELQAVKEKVDLEIARLRSRDTGDDDGTFPLSCSIVQRIVRCQSVAVMHGQKDRYSGIIAALCIVLCTNHR